MFTEIKKQIDAKIYESYLQLSNEDRYAVAENLKKDISLFEEVYKLLNCIDTLCQPYDIINGKVVCKYYNKKMPKGTREKISDIIKEIKG